MEEVSDLQAALPADFMPAVHIEVLAKNTCTARRSDIVPHIEDFLRSRHCCFSNLTVEQFEDPYLQENIHSLAVCDTEHYYKERKLLQYASSTLLFSDRNVDNKIIAWNRVILLHGPPGTGKTSLCKALAQKLSIQLSDRYNYGQLVEINSHSLFSKWFSESGKLVLKMFQKITEFIEEESTLVCVLIDEVESLTAARKAAMAGTEPSDAIRVVNALLTQLDHIKQFPNVLILTTSNITGAIDLAFVDRADIKQYIGLPSAQAIYSIYHSCLTELMKKKIISSESLFDRGDLVRMGFVENAATAASMKLWRVSQQSSGLSGRTLRKLPFIAHATYVQTPTCTLTRFLDALSMAVQKQFDERKDLCKDS